MNIRAWQDYEQSLAQYEEKLAAGSDESADADAGKAPARAPKPPKRDIQMETLVGALEISWFITTATGLTKWRKSSTSAKNLAIRSRHFTMPLRRTRLVTCLPKTIFAQRCVRIAAVQIRVFDGVAANVPMVHAAGGCAIVHSDSPNGIQRLNQEAASIGCWPQTWARD